MLIHISVSVFSFWPLVPSGGQNWPSWDSILNWKIAVQNLFLGLKIKRMLNADDEVTSQNSDGDPMPDVIKARENGECCHMVIFIWNFPKIS